MLMQSSSFTISGYRITREINSRISAITILQEVIGGGEEQMEAMSKERKAATQAAMLPGSCHCFSTPCIKHDRGGPRGGLILTPLYNLSFLFIASSTNDCLCYYKYCMFATTCFISTYIYKTVVCIRHHIYHHCMAVRCLFNNICRHTVICAIQVVYRSLLLSDKCFTLPFP